MSPEIKLVIFSLGLQAAIGIMITMMVAGKACGKTQYKGASIAAASLSIIGFLAFVFYLGRPSATFNTISQFSHSWLSRTLVFALLFIGLALIHVVVQYVKPSIKRFGWAASVAGIIDIILLANVYMNTSRQGWQGLYTFIDFLASALLLGLAFFLALHFKALETKLKRTSSIIGLISVFILAIAVVTNYIQYDFESMKLFLGVHSVLLIIGALLLFIPLFKAQKETADSGGAPWAYLGTVALGCGLAISRYLFYAHLITAQGF